MRPGLKYWGVRVVFPDSKLKPGWRYEIFRLASHSFVGYYGSGTAGNSIRYIGRDLHVHLWFSSEENACLFLSSLEDMCTAFVIPMNHVGDIEEVFTTVKPARVRTVDYRNDTGSPQHNLGPHSEGSDVSGVIPLNEIDPGKVVKMFERLDLDDITAVESVCRMHIASSSSHPNYESDPDNIVYGSHLFRQLFDGIDMPDMKPLIRISFDREDDGGLPAVEGMTCVWVNVLCKDENISRFFKGRLKEGSHEDAENPLLHHTYLYVFDVRQFQKFIAIKALEYDNKWNLDVEIVESDLGLDDDDNHEFAMDRSKSRFCRLEVDRIFAVYE